MSNIKLERVLPEKYLIMIEGKLNNPIVSIVDKETASTIYTFDVKLAIQFYANALINGDIKP